MAGISLLASALTPAATWAAPEPRRQVLVLHDSGGEYGHLGAEYGVALANLLGHFPFPVRLKPVAAYSAGEVGDAAAVFYVGSTYDEPIYHPAGSAQRAAWDLFLADVAATRRPVVWMQYNLQHLKSHLDAGGPDTFSGRYGFVFEGIDSESGWNRVRYKDVELLKGVVERRFPGADVEHCPQESDGAYDCDTTLGVARTTDGNMARTAATAVATATGREAPYITHGSNLWYVGDMPFSYSSEGDRYLAFADLLHDILGSDHREDHRALVRLEDVDAATDVGDLEAVAEVLESHRAPYGVAAIPFRRDPSLDPPGGPPHIEALSQSPVAKQLVQEVDAGRASIVQHGTSHQWDGGPNPFNGMTGDDFEFYRVTENPDHSLNFVSPLPEDSPGWAAQRLHEGARELERSGLRALAWEAPHYLASAAVYRAGAKLNPVHWGRVAYFSPGPGGGERPAGQFFPYLVRDTYGQTVIPEDLGNVEPEVFKGYPRVLPADLIRRAARTLVVRDGFASFFFHPFFEPRLLDEVLTGIESLGYRFVAPCTLVSTCR